MPTIVNNLLKNKGLVASFGKISFNENGEADVTEEQSKKLLQLSNYFIKGAKKADQPKIETVSKVEDKSVEPKVEEQKAEAIDLDKMNIPQLRKYAKEKNIDLGSAKSKEEIIAVING